MRSGYRRSTERAITAHEAWLFTHDAEDRIINRVDRTRALDRKRDAEVKLLAMPVVGRVS